MKMIKIVKNVFRARIANARERCGGKVIESKKVIIVT
jgi:hypothetical protein